MTKGQTNEEYWKELLKWIDTIPDQEFLQVIDKLDYKSVPKPCRHCPNHPRNGGSGICHCILGSPLIS